MLRITNSIVEFPLKSKNIHEQVLKIQHALSEGDNERQSSNIKWPRQHPDSFPINSSLGM